MDAYREFWSGLIFEGYYPSSPDRYWGAVVVFVLVCLIIGIASGRLRLLAPFATLVILAAYVAALTPFMVWTASCPRCESSFSYDIDRTAELYALHANWGGFFAMGIAAVWLGVLLWQGAKAIMLQRTRGDP